MANVTINSVENLNNDVLELKSKVNNSLKSNIDNLNSVLSSIGNYSNNGLSANVGDISSSLKSNFDNGLNDMINATENIFNYASYINEFNVDDYDSSSEPVNLTSKYNSSYLNIVNTNLDNDDDKDSIDDEDEENKPTTPSNAKNDTSSSKSSTSEDDTSNKNKDTNNNSNNTSSSNKGDKGNSSSSETPTGNELIPSSAILINDVKDNLSENSLSIINNVTFDNEGFAKFEDRYVIQMNGVFGDVGDYIDIMQSDGSTLNCIIGLTEENTTSNAINFFTNQNLSKSIAELHPNWLKNIVSIDNKGNYFNNVK